MFKTNIKVSKNLHNMKSHMSYSSIAKLIDFKSKFDKNNEIQQNFIKYKKYYNVGYLIKIIY